MNLVSPIQKQPISCAVFSASGGNTSMLIRDLLRNQKYSIPPNAESLDEFISSIEKQNFKLIVIDDSKEQPASLLVRKFMKNPAALSIPTLCLLDTNQKAELSFLSALEHITISPRPLTPDKFYKPMQQILQKWESGFHPLLKQAMQQIKAGNHETGLRMLTKLNEHKGARPLVAPILSHYYQLTNNPQTAEKILLAAIKESPRVASLILALSELYVQTAMPMMAYRLLMGAKAAFGACAAIQTDLVEVCIMLNRLDEAEQLLNELFQAGVEQNLHAQNMAKVLFAQGKKHKLDQYITRGSLIQKFEDSWNTDQAPPPNSSMAG